MIKMKGYNMEKNISAEAPSFGIGVDPNTVRTTPTSITQNKDSFGKKIQLDVAKFLELMDEATSTAQGEENA